MKPPCPLPAGPRRPVRRARPSGAATLLATVAALLAGCSTPVLRSSLPAPAMAAPVPAAWSAGGAAPAAPAPANPAAHPATPAADLARWWQQLGDAQLSALVERAQSRATSVASAGAALAQARALRTVAAAALQPTLDASGYAKRVHSSDSASASHTVNAAFDASWEPDLFGKNRATLGAREADTRQAEANLQAARVAVAAELAQDYLSLRAAQLRQRIALRNLAAQRDTAQITAWRVQAGLENALALAQARTAVAQTEATLPALALAVRQSAHAIALLTGDPPAALDAALQVQTSPQAQAQAPAQTPAPAPEPAAPAATPADADPPPRLPQPAADLALAFPAQTLRQRPDVRAAEAAVQAAWARADAADAARYPSLSLSGTLGLTALALGKLASAPLVATLLGSASVPIADGGAARATVQAQQAATEQALASWRGTVLTALKEVEDALAALDEDRRRADALARAAQAAGDAALLAEMRWRSGLIDFLTVLDTQRTRLAAEDSLASAQASVAADHVRLYQVLGGGWQAADPVPDTASR